MHVSSALAGVQEQDRCRNWKKGVSYPCGEVKERASSGGFLSMLGIGK